MSVRSAVIFEQAECNWAAYVPDLPGCITTGRTLEETERNIREAIEGHLQTLSEFGEPAPQPSSVAREKRRGGCQIMLGVRAYVARMGLSQSGSIFELFLRRLLP